MNYRAEEYYKNRCSHLEIDLKKVLKKGAHLYLVRLLLFIFFVAFAVVALSSEGWVLPASLALLSLGLFIYVVLYDLKLSKKRANLESRLKFNSDELETLGHKFDFRDSGEQFSQINPNLSADFDIFGNGSLFQFINRSVTAGGKSRFASSLVLADLNRASIEKRRGAIEELSEKQQFLEDFISSAASILSKGDEVENLLKWLKEKSPNEQLLNVARFGLPILIFVFLILTLCELISFTFPVATFLLSLLLVQLYAKKLNAAHSLLGKNSKIFDKYSSLISAIEKEQFLSPLLTQKQCSLTASSQKASGSIGKLNSLLVKFDYRFNAYVSIFLNGLFLFDFHTFASLQRWKNGHKDEAGAWFDTLFEVDSLLGFAIYGFNFSETTTSAQIVDDDFYLAAHQMGHPLISSDVRINNSIEISNRPAIVIITGANMAGKSTFMRTLAVNMILATNGAAVAATSFKFTPTKIFSSIKIEDSLMNRESYFYAELLRMSKILEDIEHEPNSMVVLDEILRGTNTLDKQHGTVGVLKRIIAHNGVAIIATHDLAVGKLEEEYPSIAKNYCFEVEIEGDRLSFDYKLKRGVSSKLNASHLMRQMGIIE